MFNKLGLLDYEILAWEKAYDIRPDIFWSLLLYTQMRKANQLRDTGQISESIPLYEAIIQKFPTSETPLAELAWAYLLQGETKLAVSTLEKAIPISSSNYQFYMRAGDIYEQCGLFDHALAAYQKARQIFPDAMDATKAIDRLQNP